MSNESERREGLPLELFAGAARDEAAEFYPGALRVRKNPDLDADERAAEARAVHALESRREELIRRYESLHGNYLAADEAKELFDEYAQSYQSRKRLVQAVHFASGALVKAIWDRRLGQAPSSADEFVLFTAGGPGAGKTSAVTAAAETKELRARAYVVYDTMLAEVGRSDRKIREVLETGRRAVVVYVYRPVEKAMVGVVERAARTGRTVTLGEVARRHFECQETILALAESYSGDPRVEFIVLDNSGEAGRAAPIPISKLGGELRRDMETIARRAAEALDGEYFRRAGTASEVSPTLYITIRDSGVEEQ